MKQKKIIIFQARIACIGGVETHLFNLSLALKDYYNVVVLYDTCPNQEHIRRLKEIVDVEKYDESKTYECDICIRNSIFWIMPNNIIANRYIEMLHADYEWLNKNAILNEWDKAEKIGCGEFVAKQYKKVKGLDKIIVASAVETCNLVGNTVLWGKKENGSHILSSPEYLYKFYSVHFRHHYIKNYHIVICTGYKFQCLNTVIASVHTIALVAQHLGYKSVNIFFIFNDKYSQLISPQ